MKKIITSIVLLFLMNAGAQILESYPPSSGIFQPTNYINMNGKMYYFARNATYQWALYSTDGTATGNAVVKIINQQYGPIMSTDIDIKFNDYKIVFNNKLYFTALNQLWQSDGTAAGTFTMPNLQIPKYFKIFNGRLYFTAYGNGVGTEVWSTDGTVAGTTLLKDIYPGTNPSIDSSQDPHFTVFNNKLFFVANDSVTGWELWSTDGTTAGTALFKNLLVTESESTIYNQGAFRYVSNYSTMPFKVANNKMYFSANSDYSVQYGGNFKLFETDGTSAGTVPVFSHLSIAMVAPILYIQKD